MSGRSRNLAWLGLGGNIGDPQDAMARALQAIDADPRTRVCAVSSVYRTPPWGKTDQPDFLNAVAGVETGRSPRELLEFASVELSLKNLMTFPCVRILVERGKLELHGAFFGVATGRMLVRDPSTGIFEPIDGQFQERLSSAS